MIGRIVHGRYKLIDERGSGSMAVVYIARDMETNRIFAVKALNRKAASDAELLQRFWREFDLLKQLTGPYVIRPVAWGEERDIHYIVMDYVDGHNLKQLVEREGPLPALRAIDITRQAALGLESAAERGIVHRDVKPQNIILTVEGVVKLTDFGLARSHTSPPITISNVFLGTPYYVAPEQADNGRSADARSDLYSLGCVFFELVTGRVPFEGDTAVDVVVQHLRSAIPSICTLRPELPMAYDAFIQRALAKQATQRFQSAREFMAGLEQLREVTPEGDAPATATPPPTQMIPRLVFLATNQAFMLLGSDLVIGRSDPQKEIYPDIDLAPIDTQHTVSRRHARLYARDGRFFIEDQNAFNKTRLNGVALTPHQEYELQEGDVIRLGNVDLRFEVQAR
jgi:serine/threonine protein kinase